MNKCLKSKYLLTNLATYLPIKTLISLSHTNEFINKSLDPEKNAEINFMFLEDVTLTFFQYHSDKNFQNKKNLLSNFLTFSFNWKSFLKEIKNSFKAYTNEKIKNKVLDCFKIHMYLPDLRKENKHLEFESSSIHQTFMYDLLFRSTCNSNFYGKHISLEYMTKKIDEEKKEEQKNQESGENQDNKEKNENEGKKNDKEKEKNKEKEEGGVKILREGLYFEDKLKDFKHTFAQFVNNLNYKDIIDNVVKYNYEYLNYEYKNNYNIYTDEIIVLLLWITHCFMLNCQFVYNYINDFRENTNEKFILIEFIQKHNEIINCALLLNSNFGNINIIINQYKKYSSILEEISNSHNLSLTPSNSGDSNSTVDKSSFSTENTSNTFSENFALYKYFLEMIKKNIYDKLFSTITNEKDKDKKDKILVKKFNILIKNLCKDIFENFEEKYKPKGKNMDFDDYDDINMICDDDEDCMSLGEDFVEKEREPTEKETLEGIMNLAVDHTINEEKANGINHTELIVTEEYVNIENILIEEFGKSLIYYMKENKSNSYLFEIIETMTKFKDNERGLARNSDSLTLINRTKKRLMEKLFKTLFKKVLNNFELSYLSHIKIENNSKRIVLSSTELQNCGKYECDLKDLPSKKRMKVVENVEEEVKYLKTLLLEKYIKGYFDEKEKNETEQLINDYVGEDRIENVLLVKKMIWFYHKEMEMYENKNEKVVKLLKKGSPIEKIFESIDSLSGKNIVTEC